MGLIEILVAVLILAFGALGIALMQTHSLSSNNSSMGRSMAVVMSYSILEAMRADRVAAEGGSYDGTVEADDCPTDTDTLIQRQLRDWCQQLGQVLGQYDTTQGTIDCDSGYCTITVQYDDSRIGNVVEEGAGASAGGSATRTVVTKALL